VHCRGFSRPLLATRRARRWVPASSPAVKQAIDGQLNLEARQLRSQYLALLTVQQLRCVSQGC
jgi:hypothetical protein